MKVKNLFVIIFISITSFSFSQKLVQYSTIDALLKGVYDGNITLNEIKSHGNFGIGTFNHLDGEMIIIDGHIFRVQYDGRIVEPNPETTKSPFAVTTNFVSENSFKLDAETLSDLKLELDKHISTPNHFYAFKISGRFSYVKTRSVPKQNKPYKSLASVVENQAIFTFSDVSGTLIGFRSPEFINGINVPGYHLHFITDDKTGGGHLLAVKVKGAIVEKMEINDFELLIPNTDDFNNLEFSKKENKDLKKVEMDSK